MSVPITVNGAPEHVAPGETIASLLERLGLSARPCAVERNRRVVPRREHAEAELQAGDEIEIVTLVGGG